jgi:hypothetical protein
VEFPGLEPVQPEVEGDGSGWFQTGWWRGVEMPPFRRGDADATRACWYFAEPFYDD